MFRKILVTLLIVSWSVSTVSAADNAKDPDSWQCLAEPYGWIPRVPLTAANGEELAIDRSQIVGHLKGLPI